MKRRDDIDGRRHLCSGEGVISSLRMFLLVPIYRRQKERTKGMGELLKKKSNEPAQYETQVGEGYIL